MEENGRLVQFIFNTEREVIAEKENEWIVYIRGSELLASSSDYAKTYYHYANDEMGSITHIVDDKEILNHYEYDAWGNVVNQKETVKNRFKFTGEQLDHITQQYYLRARFYNPVIARFTQEDTYRGDGLNLYVYCRNNPVKYVDPTGNNSCPGKEKVLSKAKNRLIPGQEGIVTGGNSRKLGKNMMESMGLPRETTWGGYEAQHIIPKSLNDHEVLIKIGMDLDDPTNGIFLRNKKFGGVSATTRHQGGHKEYNDFVRNRLNEISEAFGNDIGQLEKEVYKLQQNLKKMQENGVPIYTKDNSLNLTELLEKSYKRYSDI